jgi:methionine synthase I (cobalamin-dependent)
LSDRIRRLLQAGQLIIGDGAFGTQLQARGLPPGSLPEAWNWENPVAVQAVYRAYAEAGSDYVAANTFGGNAPRLKEAGLLDRAEEVNRLGVRLAKEAVGEDAQVGACIGPTGRLLAPYGEMTLDELEAIYRAQLEVVLDAGADLILVETHHDAQEACTAVMVAKALAPEIPVFCQFAFNAKGRTMMGLKAADAARAAEEAGADVVGANCGDGPEAVRVALEAMRPATPLPLLAKANAGIPQAGAHGEAIWDVTTQQMVEHARAFRALGAQVIGGCCGTTPDTIRAIVAALRG